MPAAAPSHSRRSAAINKVVFVASAIGIALIAGWAIVAPANASQILARVVGWISTQFGWFYIALVAVVVAFVMWIGLSRYGRVRMGADQERPRYPLYSWGAMLFAAGIGVDLLFFAVAEPVAQYMAPLVPPGGDVEAARQAVAWTIFHYGISGWALYALIGMCLGYFAYRLNMPLTIRSALYPLIGRRVHGTAGNAVEVAAMLGTVFGVATSLGIGVVQLNYGLKVMFGVPESRGVQLALIAVAVSVATISAVSGVDKGIRRLSEFNVGLAIMLLGYVVFTGKTGFLLNALVMNVGDYVTNFVPMSLDTFAYHDASEWLGMWTLFFWAWWIAWAPFVGLFLARISRGRTLRQFVVGTLTVPFAFIVLWVSIFGNSALSQVRGGDRQFAQLTQEFPERGLYILLQQYPGSWFLIGLAILVGLLLYITSADSAALVMSNFTATVEDESVDGPRWSRVFWAVVTGVLCIAMLLVDGIPTLQAATVVFGLPFSLVVIVAMLGLVRALRRESLRPEVTPTPVADLRSWTQRLRYAVSYADAATARRFVETTAVPAVADASCALAELGAPVLVVEGTTEDGLPSVTLTIDVEGEDFVYQVLPVAKPMPSYSFMLAPLGENYYSVEVYGARGTLGYDIIDYTAGQVSADVLDRLTEHLHYIELASQQPPSAFERISEFIRRRRR